MFRAQTLLFLNPKFTRLALMLGLLAVNAAGCGSDSTADEKQRPPTTGYADAEAWLTSAFYKDWHCETAVHDARSPSPHGKNRICSNDLLSAHTTGTYPVDAASVKELYNDAGTTIVGYAIGRHVSTGTTGASWYWYERVPQDSAAPHDSNGVVADGLGTGGPAKAICVGCHAGAGSDANHSGHDLVYTQVR